MKILPVICCICAVLLLNCSPKETVLPEKEVVKNIKNPAEKYILSTETFQKPTKAAEKAKNMIVLNGKAFYDNETVVTEFFVSATPRSAEELLSTNGHLKNRIILTDPDGNFEISGLREAFYTFDLLCQDAIPIQTNLQIITDESYLDLEFVKAPSVSGMVILAESGEPVPDVMVCFTSHSTSLPPQTVTTDNNGEFSLPAPVSQNIHGSLEVKEPEYAPVKIYLRPSDVKRNYVLVLREAGIISGKVINQFDKPVKGVIVETQPQKWPEEKTRVIPEERDLQELIKSWYEVRSETPTDELGQFVISNAAAPAIHYVMAEYIQDRHYRPAGSVVVTVTPGETATVEIRVFEKPCMLLKVRDSKGTPVLNYNFALKSKTEHTSSSSGKHVVLSSDTWERVSTFYTEDTDRVILNLAVSAPSGGKAEKNNIVCIVGLTNSIELVLDDSMPVTVAGAIMKKDGTPVADNAMHGNYSSGHIQSKTDHTGSFFLENIPADLNSKMTLGCVYNGIYYSTNILIGKEFIEWTLPEMPEAPEKSATNRGSIDFF